MAPVKKFKADVLGVCPSSECYIELGPPCAMLSGKQGCYQERYIQKG